MKLFGKGDPKSASSNDQADFYGYDKIPHELRVKIFFRIEKSLQLISSHYDGFQLSGAARSKGWARIIYEIMNRKGITRLSKGNAVGDILYDYLLNCDAQDVLIVIEEFFAELQRESNRSLMYIPPGGARVKSPTIYDEINSLFSEYRIGYEFLPDAANMVRARRIDSTYAQALMVKPTLALLRNLDFKAPSNSSLKYNPVLSEAFPQLASSALA